MNKQYWLMAVLFIGLVARAGVSFAGAPRIAVKDQRSVLSPMIVGAGAAFMSISNDGSADDSLISARTDMAGAIV
ncbi:MAG TPA: copper-binding protein, partial [Nitrospirota bacterium]